MSDLPKGSDLIGVEGVKIAVDSLKNLAENASDEEVRLRASEFLLSWGAESPWMAGDRAANVDPEPEF